MTIYVSALWVGKCKNELQSREREVVMKKAWLKALLATIDLGQNSGRYTAM